jgi:hypothetical protein
VKPDAGESGEGNEVGFIFLVPRGEAAEVFEPREAAFDAISLFVTDLVVFALLFTGPFGRDDGTVYGTLIQAWASHKSFRAKDGSDSDGAMARTSTAGSAPTTHINRPPTRTRGCTRRATARSRIWPIWATRSWRTAMA